MKMPDSVHLKGWIEKHRNDLKPPIGNKIVWENAEFVVMMIGGPNSRKDFHVDPSPEFFHQIEGDIILRVIEKGKQKDIHVREGEMFLLPSKVPHMPIRPKNTLGLVVERKRKPTEKEHFLWFCEKCKKQLAQHKVFVKNLEKDLPAVLENFYGNKTKRTCKHCGHVMIPPA